MAGPPWRSTTCLMLCATALAAARVAAADLPRSDERVRAQLELIAPEGCGTGEELAARVTRRTSRIELLAGGPSEPGPTGQARTVKAEIVRAGEHWLVASMSIDQPDGKRAVRRFRSRTCTEALDALGLVIAITLDPSCASGDELPAADVPVPPPPPSPPAAATISTPAPPSPSARHIELGAALLGHAISGAGPRIMPGLSIQLAMALEGESVLSPAARVSLIHVARDGYVADGGSAGFALDAAGVDLCPVRVHAWRLTARPCGAAVVGRLRARGTDTFFPETHDRLFVTLGGSLVLAARVTQHVEILGSFSGAAPLVRDSFQFSPAVFYRVPAVTWTAALGLGARFP